MSANASNHPQHVGAVRGKRATADRAGQHARQLKDAHASERARARSEGFCRRVADLFQRDQRQRGHRPAVRMHIPLRQRARHRDNETGLRRRVLERFCVPL